MPYSRERLGELLVRAGLITSEQLDGALAAQAAGGGKIGEVLVRELILTEGEIAHALAGQKGLEFVRLTGATIDRAVATLIPLRMARRRLVIPIALEGDALTLAMADPLDVEAVDEVELTTGMKVTPVVAPASQVRYAIDKYISGGEVLQEIGGDEQDRAEIGRPDEQTVDADDGVPVVRIVNQLIREAVEEQASDIHFEPGDNSITVRFRVDGVLHEAAVLPRRIQAGLLSRLKVMADLDITERRRPQDGRIALMVDGRHLDFRVATLPTPLGEAITLRILDHDASLRTVEELGMDPTDLRRLMSILRRPYGALLVSGPTGSGKSTTLYSLLNEVNDPSRKIITIEDPVEYRMAGITQIAVNARVGLTFAAGLRTILRSDPDVIMVGEVRDPETAEMAVRSALTGHLVLSSIHTNDAPSALTRLTDMGVPAYITSSALAGALAQRLVRRLCPDCKRPSDPGEERLLAAGFTEHEVSEGMLIYEPVGCDRCHRTGYRGRLGVFELMEFDHEISALYLAQATAERLRAAALAHGMRTLRRDALDKVKQGHTSLEEIDRVVV